MMRNMEVMAVPATASIGGYYINYLARGIN
jgi:hypothetical protein